jgi:salicylate hydroxylase
MLATLRCHICEYALELLNFNLLIRTRAQGAALAVEDGAVLGALFNKSQTALEISKALEIYENIRKPRTTRIAQASVGFGDTMHMHDGEAQIKRDITLVSECKPSDGYPIKWFDPVFQNYIFGYDAEAEAEKAWDLYKAGNINSYLTHSSGENCSSSNMYTT